MEALVVYESVYGHTHQIAQAIGTILSRYCQAQVLSLSEIDQLPSTVDFLVVGSPNHHLGLSTAMRLFLGGVPRGSLRGVAAAVFDTRYQGTRWIIGSAAVDMARTLKRKGARIVMPPESFLLECDVPPNDERRHTRERLIPGEKERASIWARRCCTALIPVI